MVGGIDLGEAVTDSEACEIESVKAAAVEQIIG